ncbi:Uncharacterized protein APZ42_030096 [Daphnia magna]|uniref:Reverse transcriptase domain-containing protein n=1 Tax=Daphnia magna TaxID=35525 RepID=A0A164P284_9CRUS|nr:Uncharacterized protein APZ42_030096 [Daphnia magna]
MCSFFLSESSAFETAHSHSAIVINAHVVIGVSLALALIPARGTHELVRLSSFGHVVVHQTLLLPMFIDVMVKEVEDNVSWQKSDAMAVPIPARVVAILIGAMATAIKTGVTAVITKMVASATEEKAEKTTRNLLSSSSRSGCLQQWLSFSNDQWILSTVVHGYVIDFLEPPVQHSTPSEIGWMAANHHLKRLNAFIAYKHFKMEGLECVKFLLQRGDWMVKSDLQYAYFLVPLAPDHCRFLRFYWKGNLYEYLYLAFGLCSAPRVFTKLLKPVVAFLRERGIRLIIYLDDLLILNQSRDGLLLDLKIVISLLEFLAFIINYEKSFIVPQHILEYLGMIINNFSLSFSLPSEKVKSIVKLCDALVSDKSLRVKLRDLAKVMGIFFVGHPLSPLPAKAFQKIRKFSSVEIPGFVMALVLGDPWTAADTHRHINELELLAAYFSMQAFANSSDSISIHLFLDNSTAVAYIN